MDFLPETGEIETNHVEIPTASNIVPSSSGSTVQNRDVISPNFVHAASGWRHGSNGNMEINDLTLRSSRFRVHRTADQTLGASGLTQVQFNVKGYDERTEFNTSTYRFVVATAGFYLIHAQVYIDTLHLVDQSEIDIILRKNGSNISSTVHQTSGTGVFSLQITDIMSLAAADYIEVFINNNIAATITAVGDISLTHFEGHRLS